MAEDATRRTHETYVNDTPPRVDQLFKLASYAMASANETNTRRAMTKTPRTHFSVQEIDYLNEFTGTGEGEYPVESRRRVALRIGRRSLQSIPLKSWSLKFFDTSWYEYPSGDWSGVRNLYRFEWDKRGINLADREITVVPSIDAVDMYSRLEHFAVSDDMADVMYLHQQMSQVTSDDLEDILDDIGDYYSQTDLFQHRRPAA